MKSSTGFGFSSSLLFFFIVAASINVVYSEDAAASIVVDSETTRTCLYELIVRTGDAVNAGTDSRISITLSESAGERVEIPDLKEWGSMLPGHDYFEHGKRDFFVVESPCSRTPAPVCEITVTSDGSGQKPGWFLEDVVVIPYFRTSVRPSIKFFFNQWLAKDEPPYQLTASINKCEE